MTESVTEPKIAAAPRTETPVRAASPGTLERIQVFIGETARPVALLGVGAATFYAIITAANRITDGNDGAVLLGVILSGLAALYGAKSLENVGIARGRREADRADH